MFSIIITLGKIQYKFESIIMLEIPNKIIVEITNLPIYYWMFEISYTNYYQLSSWYL